jgi:Ca2+-binding RTX toxin-like protein
MTTYLVNQNSNTKIKISVDGDKWIIDKGATISVYGGNAVYFDTLAPNASMEIRGTVLNTGNGEAIGINAENDVLTVTATGKVLAESTAVFINGDHATITNAGKVSGETAIDNDANGTILINSGKLIGVGHAVHSSDGNFSIANEGRISSQGVTILSETSAGEKFGMINDGLVKTASKTAIVGGAGEEGITNHGTIVGNVKLGAGNDSFNTAEGMFTGKAYGGMGDDEYKVANQDTHIVEKAGEGEDKVISLHSYMLGANFENLELWGAGKSSATGNGLGNTILGNDHANIIKGMGGDDVLSGGEGHDRLFGGAGSDTFHFGYKDGTDKILDFDAKGADHDTIDLEGFVANFEALQPMLHQKGADVVVEVDADYYVYVLKDVKLGDLDAGDFLFA